MTTAELQIVEVFGGMAQIGEAPVDAAAAPHAFDAVTVGTRLASPFCFRCGAGLLHEVHATEALRI
jgi:hypothetical protein